jgi:hypothetical protein
MTIIKITLLLDEERNEVAAGITSREALPGNILAVTTPWLDTLVRRLRGLALTDGVRTV